MKNHLEWVRAQIEESCRVKQSLSPELLNRVVEFAEKGAAALTAGRKLVFFGNGGSAADAQHLAAELVVRLNTERGSLPALALTTNTSVLTAAGNDFGFENVFARQIESLVAAGDLLVALSTSGTSPNIVRGAEAGRKRGAVIIALTGEGGGALADKADLLLAVPSRDPQRIQEAHITLGHIVCSLIERLRVERRRSQRVIMRVPVTVSGTSAEGKPFQEETVTAVINAHGCLAVLETPVRLSQILKLHNRATRAELDCRVVHVGKQQGGKALAGLEFLRASPTFWQVAFPPADWQAAPE
jgi:D-sedoheptulose 7-phosphate isomerase